MPDVRHIPPSPALIIRKTTREVGSREKKKAIAAVQFVQFGRDRKDRLDGDCMPSITHEESNGL